MILSPLFPSLFSLSSCTILLPCLPPGCEEEGQDCCSSDSHSHRAHGNHDQREGVDDDEEAEEADEEDGHDGKEVAEESESIVPRLVPAPSTVRQDLPETKNSKERDGKGRARKGTSTREEKMQMMVGKKEMGKKGQESEQRSGEQHPLKKQRRER